MTIEAALQTSSTQGTYSGISPCLHRELLIITDTDLPYCVNSWKLLRYAFKHASLHLHTVTKFIHKVEAVTCVILS